MKLQFIAPLLAIICGLVAKRIFFRWQPPLSPNFESCPYPYPNVGWYFLMTGKVTPYIPFDGRMKRFNEPKTILNGDRW